MDSYTNLLEVVFHLSDEALVSLQAIVAAELRHRELEKKKKETMEIELPTFKVKFPSVSKDTVVKNKYTVSYINISENELDNSK